MPRFRETPKTVTVNPGERAVFTCSIINVGTKTVTSYSSNFTHVIFIHCFLHVFLFSSSLAYEYDEHGNKGHRRNLPMFAEVPDNVTAAPGERAVLLCSIENLGTKTVSNCLL